MRSLRKEFAVSVGAGESFIRINTDEQADAIKTATEVCAKYGWELRVWDETVGTVWYNGAPPTQSEKKGGVADMLNQQGPPNPLAEILKFLGEPAKPDPKTLGEVLPVVLLMKNLHLGFDKMKSPMVSAIQHLVGDKVQDHPRYAEMKHLYDAKGIKGKSDTGKFLVGLMPAEIKLPPEISPLAKVLDHDLPDEEEMGHILDGVIVGEDPDEDDVPAIAPETRRKACKFALGLTRLQAEGVFAACMVQYGDKPNFEDILPRYVWENKSAILNKEGLVTLYAGNETFSDIIGQKGLKQLLKDLLTPDEADPDNPELKSKGLALVGPPRTGKTLTCKAAGNELGLPTLQVDVGAWFGGLVGDTERNTRKGFQIIRAHAPCIAYIDEVEKVMPSARGGEHDSGVGKRMAGSFMTQLQDIKEHVFWIFTANGVEDLHEAFLADDRVDGVVYVHMPGPEQLAAGWRMYLGKFFPAEVKGTPFKHHVETDIGVLLKELASAKKVNPLDWANRLVPALMCLSAGAKRQAALDRVAKVNENVRLSLDGLLIDDTDWTLARVKSACRLARKRRRTVSQIAKMMPREQRQLAKAIARLEKWAEAEAIDAETGEAYVPDSADEDGTLTGPRIKAQDKTKLRRKVRKLD